MLHQNLIAGEWVEGVAVNRDLNPSNLDDVVGEYAQADAAQARDGDRRGARRRSRPGRAATPQERADVLDTDRHRDPRAQGRARPAARRARRARRCPRASARPRAPGSIFKFFAGEALRLAGEMLPSVRPGVEVEITREPVGVVGLITPWNFPIAIPAWKIAPALAYGNCVVFKPADLVPGCAWALADIISRAGAAGRACSTW